MVVLNRKFIISVVAVHTRFTIRRGGLSRRIVVNELYSERMFILVQLLDILSSQDAIHFDTYRLLIESTRTCYKLFLAFSYQSSR